MSVEISDSIANVTDLTPEEWRDVRSGKLSIDKALALGRDRRAARAAQEPSSHVPPTPEESPPLREPLSDDAEAAAGSVQEKGTAEPKRDRFTKEILFVGYHSTLRTLRERWGLSKYALSVRSKVSGETIQRIEKQFSDVRESTLEKLAVAFGLLPEELHEVHRGKLSMDRAVRMGQEGLAAEAMEAARREAVAQKRAERERATQEATEEPKDPTTSWDPEASSEEPSASERADPESSESTAGWTPWRRLLEAVSASYCHDAGHRLGDAVAVLQLLGKVDPKLLPEEPELGLVMLRWLGAMRDLRIERGCSHPADGNLEGGSFSLQELLLRVSFSL